MESKKEEKIGEALLKVALGYQLAEVTEEYAEVDGALKLTKRKKTKKDVPPDLKAVQMLLENGGGDAEYSGWSDEELEREKERLLRVLEKGLQAQRTGDVSKRTADGGALVGADGECSDGADGGSADGAGSGGGADKPAAKERAKKSVRRKVTVKTSVVKKAAKKKTTKS